MTGSPVTCAQIVRDVRERLFSGTTQPWRIGAEIEFIPVEPATGRVAPVHPGMEEGPPATLPFIRTLARREGWVERTSLYGVPAFVAPALGTLTFEPGGQLEFSTLPCDTPSALLEAIRQASAILETGAAESGLTLLAVGLDPCNDVASVPLRFDVPRYRRMNAHFDRIGPAGARMMRQTASLQLSIDVEPADMLESWRLLNGLAPVVIAAFANSPRYHGAVSGDASHRSRLWRELDPSRTGTFTGSDAASEYVEFALGASAFLVDGDGAARPFGELVDGGGVSERDWHEHLSTLFPEVRPRGYLELRSADMISGNAQAALIALVVGLLRDVAARRAALEILPRPDPDILDDAACGLRGRLANLALELFPLALRACERADRGHWLPLDLDSAAAFVESYVQRRRSPADDWASPVTSHGTSLCAVSS